MVDPSLFGFRSESVGVGAGNVVVAGAKHEAPKPAAPEPAPLPKSSAMLIPYNNKEDRIRYLEHVRDYLNNALLMVEGALAAERGE